MAIPGRSALVVCGCIAAGNDWEGEDTFHLNRGCSGSGGDWGWCSLGLPGVRWWRALLTSPVFCHLTNSPCCSGYWGPGFLHVGVAEKNASQNFNPH